MVLKVLNYQILVKRLVTVPTLIIVVVCLIIYGVLDLTQTIKHQIKDAHLNNQLIASTASFSNNNLLTQQVTILLRQSPQIKAITFFSFSDQQNPTVYPLQIRGIFFDHYYGLSEPVKIALSQTQTNQNEDAQVSHATTRSTHWASADAIGGCCRGTFPARDGTQALGES